MASTKAHEQQKKRKPSLKKMLAKIPANPRIVPTAGKITIPPATNKTVRVPTLSPFFIIKLSLFI